MLDEHQRLEEAVVDDQVLEAVQEHHALAVVVLDEFLDDLGERPDRGRVVEVFARRVAEPNDSRLGQAAFPPHPIRILAGDAQGRSLLTEEHFEEAEAQLRLLLLHEVTSAFLEFHGHRGAKCLSLRAHFAFLRLHPSHRFLHSATVSSNFVLDYH